MKKTNEIGVGVQGKCARKNVFAQKCEAFINFDLQTKTAGYLMQTHGGSDEVEKYGFI